MNDEFTKRISAAASAAWWTLLVGVGTIWVTWIIYLAMMAARPAWMLSLFGPDISWSMIQTITLWFVSAFKLCLWLILMAATFLSMWARQLRRA